jgi:hypothetical protein
MSMTIEKMRSLVSRLPDMSLKARKKTVERIREAGFIILAVSPAYNMVRVGVPQDVMEHVLLEELTEDGEPEVGDLIDNEDEAHRLPVGVVLIDPSSGDVYRKATVTEHGYSDYKVIGATDDVFEVESFPVMIAWLPS